MSEESQVKLVIRISAENVGTPEYVAMLEKFDAVDEKLEGIISIPKNNTFITDSKHLLMIKPDRIDFAISLAENEYVILTEG